MARKAYTPEFRQTAVRLARQPGVSVEKIANEIGIACWTLRRWMAADTARTRVSSNVRMAPSATQPDPQQRIRELEAQVRQPRMERDILKKATAFFAKEQP
ncbi:MAG: transposase [Phycisphaerales bacterium]